MWPRPSSGAGAGWDVATLAGTPEIGSQFLSANRATSKLRVGQTLVTNSDSRASISDKELGEIRVDPNSRIRLLEFVADVRPLYAEANLVAVPMLESAGTNLKVLEAMAMRRAVVSTQSGCAGLGLEHAATA